MSNVTAKMLVVGIPLALAVITMGLFVRSLGNRVEPLALEVHKAPLEVKVQAVGVLQAHSSSTVSVRPRGQVLVWLLPEGRAVGKGTLLARFDDTTFRDRVNNHRIELEIAEARLREREEELKATDIDLQSRITMLEADLETAQAELKRSRSLPLQEDLDRSKLDLDYAAKTLEAAQADHERLRSLATKGVAMMSELKEKEMAVIASRTDKQAADIRMKLVRDGATEQELETARLKAEQIRIDLVQAGHELPGQLRVAEGNVTGARAQVDKARSRLERSEKSLSEMQVKSPADGMLVYRTIRGRKVEVGASFWWSAQLFDIVDISRMRVRVKVLETDVRSVKEGQTVEVRVVTIPDTVLKGTVTRVARVGKDKSEDDLMTRQELRTKSGVQAFDVEIVIDDADVRLRPNVSAGVSILVEKLDDVLTVPLDAVFEKDGVPVVRVLTWRGPKVRTVKLGSRDKDWVVVTEGLTEGEQVLLGVPDPDEGLDDLGEPAMPTTVSADQVPQG